MGSAAAPFSDSRNITLDRSSQVPYYEQLCDAVRVRIENGLYQPDSRLPSIEDFADHLKVSRNIVKLALQKLTTQGLLTGDPVAGFLVKNKSFGPNMGPSWPDMKGQNTSWQPYSVQSHQLPTTQPRLAYPIASPGTAAQPKQDPPASPTPVSGIPVSATPVNPSSVSPTSVNPTPVSAKAEDAPSDIPKPSATSAATPSAAAPQPQPLAFKSTVSAPPATPSPLQNPHPVTGKPVSSPVKPAESPALKLESRTAIPFNRVANLDQIDLARLHTSGAPRPFRPGLPATAEFPLDVWERLRAQLLSQKSPELLEYTGTFGYLPLRESIATRLRNARGVKCSAEQVIICAGAQQALNLVINTLVSPGDSVGLEEPGYYGVKAAFLQAGAKVNPLLVDEDGLSVPDSRRQNPPLIIYTTPANQFPLGAQLSLLRRLQLLEFARKASTWVIEDDSDGDFRYSGRPVPSLQASDEHNRVIYLGTTGKTLFPSLEVSFIVVPLSLMESFSKTKEIMGGHASVIDQATFSRFLGDGHFDRHVGRMNLIYSQRLNTLAEAVDSELSEYIDLEPAIAGLQTVGWLKRGLDERAVTNAAAAAGVELPLLSAYGHTALMRPGVVFGFASYTEKKIKDAVKRLGSAMKTPQAPQNQVALTYSGGRLAPQKTGFMQRLFNR